MNLGKLIACVLVLASIAAKPYKPPKGPPPPPTPTPTGQATLYVNFGRYVLDNTPTWGIAHPGVTPAAGMDDATIIGVLDRAQAIALEAGCNLKIVEYTGQPLGYGLADEIVVGGAMAWASAYGYPSGTTSGLHFPGSFLSNVGPGSILKSFSCAPAIFGLTNVEMIADSIALEGIGGPAGLSEHMSTSGYMGNFTTGEGWTASEKTYLQSVYGIAPFNPARVVIEPVSIFVPPSQVPEPASWQGGLAMVVLMAILRMWRKR